MSQGKNIIGSPTLPDESLARMQVNSNDIVLTPNGNRARVDAVDRCLHLVRLLLPSGKFVWMGAEDVTFVGKGRPR